MKREKAAQEIALMCRVLGVSRSGYYAWVERGPSARAQSDQVLLDLIRRIHKDSRGTYGAPRVHAELALEHGIHCSRKRVARLMREAGPVGVHRRRKRGCTRRDQTPQAHPDLVERQFSRPQPNQLWVADLTQHATGEGWLYLATIMDVFSRRVVGWAVDARAQVDIALSTLDMAVWNRKPGADLIHHSDHGSQYTSLAFAKRLEAVSLKGSMGTVGDALDNAAAESLYATLQTEPLDRSRWPTTHRLATALFDCIEVFYN